MCYCQNCFKMIKRHAIKPFDDWITDFEFAPCTISSIMYYVMLEIVHGHRLSQLKAASAADATLCT